MKDYDDIFKERLDGYEMKLPATDRDAFLNRKATRERYARLRRTYINIAVGIPAAAAIILGIMMSISLLSKQDSNSDDQQLLASANKEQTAPTQNSAETVVIVQDTEPVQEDILVEFIDEWPDEDVDFIPVQGEEDLFFVVEDQPEFPGGTNAYLDYLKNNLVYPDSCRDNNVQGRVIVTFIVEKDGSISKPEIVKSVNRLFDAEALRLITNMPKWNPGKHKGEICRVKYTLPINFRLN